MPNIALAPAVTRRRMYYETMERVLQHVDTTIVEAPGVTPYLALPEIQRRAAAGWPGRRSAGAMTRMLRNPIALGIVTILLLILVANTFSIVRETKQAVIVRFGQPERISTHTGRTSISARPAPGSLVRVPFVDRIVWIDKRIQSIAMENQQVLSADQLRLEVDAFARYRIVDPLRMYISAGTEENVGNQLRPILSSALRNELGRQPFAALLSPERGQMMDNIQSALNRVARQYGAEIVNVRIKHADLPDGTPLEFGL